MFCVFKAFLLQGGFFILPILMPSVKKWWMEIVKSSTYTEGCEEAQIDRTILYKLLKRPEFKAEIERRGDEITDEAFNLLTQCLKKAVE